MCWVHAHTDAKPTTAERNGRTVWEDAVQKDADGYKCTEVILGELFARLLFWHVIRLDDPNGTATPGVLKSEATLFRFPAEGEQSTQQVMLDITDEVTDKKTIIKENNDLHKLSPVVKLAVHESAVAAVAIAALTSLLDDQDLERDDETGEVVLTACSPAMLRNAHNLVKGHLVRSLIVQREYQAAAEVFPEFAAEMAAILDANFPKPSDANPAADAAADPAANPAAAAAAAVANTNTNGAAAVAEQGWQRAWQLSPAYRVREVMCGAPECHSPGGSLITIHT